MMVEGFLGVSSFPNRERRESRRNKGGNEQARATCVPGAGLLFLDFSLLSPFLFVLCWDKKCAGGSSNFFIFLIFPAPTKIN